MSARRAPSRLVLLGHPISHSLSPAFQGAALRAAGIPLAYEALDVAPETLNDVLKTATAQGWAGNVTIPHKRAVFLVCKRHTDVAEQAGAVNTFWVQDGELWGDNTDVAGFDAAARALGARLVEARVTLLGAGGAAAAVCVATSRWPGATVQLIARRPEEARRLASAFAHVTPATALTTALHECTLLVNATPIGLRDDVTPCDVAALPADAAVMDLVYRRDETLLVRNARRRGLLACDGSEMLLRQGAVAFERWFGRVPALDIMRAALHAAR
ncbi:MAG: shikimate dehydrogenase [Gemmatimonadetes bacterium]|nr:shikimate dehydrogenase [Gemmatimonadota bacterium]